MNRNCCVSISIAVTISTHQPHKHPPPPPKPPKPLTPCTLGTSGGLPEGHPRVCRDPRPGWAPPPSPPPHPLPTSPPPPPPSLESHHNFTLKGKRKTGQNPDKTPSKPGHKPYTVSIAWKAKTISFKSKKKPVKTRSSCTSTPFFGSSSLEGFWRPLGEGPWEASGRP